MAMLDINEIQEILPHRYPMLLVDRIVELTEKTIVGIKNVTINEPFFAGHFPSFPIMPGVLVVEAMAQIGGVLLQKSVPNPGNQLVLLASIEGAKFRKPVIPGDQLRVEITLLRNKPSLAKLQGVATVDGAVVAEATILCKLAKKAEAKTSSVQVPEPQMA